MKQRRYIYIFCTIALVAHAAFSFYHRDLRAVWASVPPVPSKESAAFFTLGDEQFSYRISGIMIQNFGDTGGRTTALTDYDFNRLGEWFFLQDHLDWRSDFIPLLAAYYFGGVEKPEALDPIIDYLAMIGQRDYREKWRWLAHAVYLARFKQGDMEKAKELAYILASLNFEGMATWTKQMPAFIAAATGDKETAYTVMMNILKEEAENLHPNEVNFMASFICERVLDKAQAAQHPLCETYQ